MKTIIVMVVRHRFTGWDRKWSLGIAFTLFSANDTSDEIATRHMKLCQTIVKIAGGDNAVPRQAAIGPFPSTPPIYKMDCTYIGDNTMTIQDEFNIYYKF